MLLVGQNKHFSFQLERHVSLQWASMGGLSFKGVTLLISRLLRMKTTEIGCVGETWQQGIGCVSSKIWIVLFFLILLKLALHILRSYLGRKMLKKCADIKQKILHKTAGIFFSSLLFWLWLRSLTSQATWYFVYQKSFLVLWTMSVRWFESCSGMYSQSCKQHIFHRCWQSPRCIQSIHTVLKRSWNWTVCRWAVACLAVHIPSPCTTHAWEPGPVCVIRLVPGRLQANSTAEK